MLEEATSIWSVLSTIFIMIVVLMLAYFATKWLGQKTAVKSGSRYIKVIDKTYIGQDKCILLIQVADQTMLVAMTSQSVVKLCDITDSALLAIPEQESSADFSSILGQMLKNTKNFGIGRKKEDDL